MHHAVGSTVLFTHLEDPRVRIGDDVATLGIDEKELLFDAKGDVHVRLGLRFLVAAFTHEFAQLLECHIPPRSYWWAATEQIAGTAQGKYSHAERNITRGEISHGRHGEARADLRNRAWLRTVGCRCIRARVAVERFTGRDVLPHRTRSTTTSA